VGLLTGPFLLLCFGHFAIDFYASSVATLQPLLAEKYSLSLAQVGTLSGVFMFGSAVLQLFFGLLSDRIHSRLFVVLGLATAGIFLSSLGVAPGYNSLLVIALLGGMGVASFHPQSTSQAASLAKIRRGLGVAIFITAGMIGLSLGPTYFSTMVEQVGLEGLPLAALPALIIAAFLMWMLPVPGNGVEAGRTRFEWAPFRREWKPLLLQYLLVVLRSVVHLGIAQFLTVYLYQNRGFTLQETSIWLTVFFISSAIASLTGGSLADRIGGRHVVLISMLACCPFFALFLGTTGWLSLTGLFLGALILLLTNPVMIVMAQDLVPEQAGTASALVMGFGWGMAGITFIPLLGWIADRVGLETVFWGVITLPVLGFVMALKLPKKPAIVA
jgi:FSR family fosmidomycin resistance protein-like MFS transporter